MTRAPSFRVIQRREIVDIQPEKFYGYRMSTHEFKRSLGLFDSTMVVAGSMVGVGIFIVTAGMSRQLGSPGWLLLSWIITGFLTICAALSYGELAAMMPAAGGQYVYLREAFSPLWGFLYGWTLFLVIQTGTIAAVAVGLGGIWECWFRGYPRARTVRLGAQPVDLVNVDLQIGRAKH